MPTKKQSYIWFLAGLKYLFVWGTPIVTIGILFQEDINKEKGGMFYYVLLSIVLAFLLIKLIFVFKDLKESVPKVVIKLTIVSVFLWFLNKFLVYLMENLESVTVLLTIWFIGLVFGSICEIIAINKDIEYVREIGVF